MIYRIKVDLPNLEDARQFARESDGTFRQNYIGAGCFPDLMDQLGLGGGRITNPRARFYFTELGWDKVGRAVAALARQRGHLVKVFRRKNPLRSKIVYEDELQVALLPHKKQRKGK